MFLCYGLQFSKRISELLLFFFWGGEGVEPPDPSPPLYTPLYIVHKIKYYATAVCKLRCIEVMFVMK